MVLATATIKGGKVAEGDSTCWLVPSADADRGVVLVGAIAAGIIAAISNDAVEEALERRLCRPMVVGNSESVGGIAKAGVMTPIVRTVE